MKKIIAILLVLLTFGSFAFAEDVIMPRLTIPTTADGGFGGPHIAFTDNVYSLFVNPAAMIRVNERSFFNLNPSIVNPQSTFELLSMVMDMTGGGGDLSSAMNLLSEKNGRISLGIGLGELPLSIAWVANGFGFALMSNVSLDVSLIGTYAKVNAYVDVMLPIGFGFKILDLGGHTIDAGITIKPFARAMGSETIDILKFASGFDDFLDGLSVPLMAGAGIDLGLMYRWDIGLSAGMTFYDIVSRGAVIDNLVGDASKDTVYKVPFTWNLGAAFDFRPGRFWPNAPAILSKSGLTFAFDWRDFGNVKKADDYLQRNSALDIGLGLQLALLDTFIFRVGMNECLPGVGIGFDLGAFKLDISYYGRELGNEPGERSVAILELSMAIRPGAKQRDWPWARKGLFSALGIGQ